MMENNGKTLLFLRVEEQVGHANKAMRIYNVPIDDTVRKLNAGDIPVFISELQINQQIAPMEIRHKKTNGNGYERAVWGFENYKLDNSPIENASLAVYYSDGVPVAGLGLSSWVTPDESISDFALLSLLHTIAAEKSFKANIMSNSEFSQSENAQRVNDLRIHQKNRALKVLSEQLEQPYLDDICRRINSSEDIYIIAEELATASEDTAERIK